MAYLLNLKQPLANLTFCLQEEIGSDKGLGMATNSTVLVPGVLDVVPLGQDSAGVVGVVSMVGHLPLLELARELGAAALARGPVVVLVHPRLVRHPVQVVKPAADQSQLSIVTGQPITAEYRHSWQPITAEHRYSRQPITAEYRYSPQPITAHLSVGT